jgi:hypothetical protein
VAVFFPRRSERDVQRRWAVIRRLPKNGEEGQAGAATERKPAAAPAAPPDAAGGGDVGDAMSWSFWEEPYGFSFS